LWHELLTQLYIIQGMNLSKFNDSTIAGLACTMAWTRQRVVMWLPGILCRSNLQAGRSLCTGAKLRVNCSHRH